MLSALYSAMGLGLGLVLISYMLYATVRISIWCIIGTYRMVKESIETQPKRNYTLDDIKNWFKEKYYA